jgi:uncharacterized membrane protein
MIPHWIIDVLGYLTFAGIILSVLGAALMFWIDKRKPPKGGYES